MLTGRILLVEDQPELRHITTVLLRSYGFEVLAAGTGADGIKIAQSVEVDAALIDLGLPDMNGRDVAKALRHLRIAILSGDPNDVTVPEATLILKKPLVQGQLFAALKLLLRDDQEVTSIGA